MVASYLSAAEIADKYRISRAYVIAIAKKDSFPPISHFELRGKNKVKAYVYEANAVAKYFEKNMTAHHKAKMATPLTQNQFNRLALVFITKQFLKSNPAFIETPRGLL